MIKYIDADRLRSEIERFSSTEYNENTLGDDVANGALDYVLGLIDSLQQGQPEVDIEKEIEEHAIYMPHGEFASDNEIIEDMEWARKEFRHFYALGVLKASWYA